MITKWLKTVVLGSLALLLIQCSSTDSLRPTGDSLNPAKNEVPQLDAQNPSVTPDPSTLNKDMQMVPTASSTIASDLQSLIDKAKEDLAQRLSLSVTTISLVETREVVWPDASLGCPHPDMKYKQIPEDGVQILLQVEGVTYNYHYGSSRGIFLCEQALEKSSKPTPIDITKLTPANLDKTSPPHPTPGNGIPPCEDQ